MATQLPLLDLPAVTRRPDHPRPAGRPTSGVSTVGPVAEAPGRPTAGTATAGRSVRRTEREPSMGRTGRAGRARSLSDGVLTSASPSAQRAGLAPTGGSDTGTWRLDDRTREIGQRGVAEARRALAAAVDRISTAA